MSPQPTRPGESTNNSGCGYGVTGGQHAHLACPFCESTVVCVVYGWPTLINGREVAPTIDKVAPVVDRACEDHLAVHVDQMIGG